MLEEFSLLYVEDDNDILEELAYFLEKKCKTLYLAQNADEGLSLFKKHNPDIIISDIQMSGMNGLDMIELIRSNGNKVPVIITSAFNESPLLIRAINMGIEGYLLKPINLKELIGKIEDLLEPAFLRQKLLDMNESLEEEILAQTAELLTYKERMDCAFAGSNDGLWDWNMLSNEMYLSPRWKAIIGYEDDEIKNELSLWKKSIHEDDLEKVEKALEKVFTKKKKNYQIEFRQKHKNGTYIWILSRAIVKFDEEGIPIRMIGTHTDITEKKEMELELIESEFQLAYAQKIAKLGSWSWDVLTNEQTWSDEIFLLHGEEAQSFKPTFEIFLNYLSEEEKEKVLNVVSKVIKNRDSDAQVIHKIKRKDGKIVYLQQTAKITYDSNTKAISMIGTTMDVTERIESEEMLKKQKDILEYHVFHDTLTDIPNRMLFNDRLKQTLAKAKRQNSEFALFFIDIDYFKEINDSFGHDVGDEVLKIFSQRLKNSIRDEDTIARIGGDEFVIIMENIRQSDSVHTLAKKIIRSLYEPLVANLEPLHVTGSIGISIYPHDGVDVEVLMKNADIAMYQAKQKGKNRYQFYSLLGE